MAITELYLKVELRKVNDDPPTQLPTAAEFAAALTHVLTYEDTFFPWFGEATAAPDH